MLSEATFSTVTNRLKSLRSASTGLAGRILESYSNGTSARGGRAKKAACGPEKAEEIVDQHFYPISGKYVSLLDLVEIVEADPILKLRLSQAIRKAYGFAGPFVELPLEPLMAEEYNSEISVDVPSVS